MAFEWRDFLALAKELSERSDAASRRTAISRAYYAIFNPAFLYLKNVRGVDPMRVASLQKTSVHKATWDAFETIDEGRHAGIGQAGKGLHKRRVKADYYSTVDGLDRSNLAVLGAERILNQLNQLLKPQGR